MTTKSIHLMMVYILIFLAKAICFKGTVHQEKNSVIIYSTTVTERREEAHDKELGLHGVLVPCHGRIAMLKLQNTSFKNTVA